MISIFAAPSYIGHGYHAHVPLHATRLSSRIRAEEMSAYLGAKFNPTKGFKDDVCIHVKPRTFDNIRNGDWVDFLDGDMGLEAQLRAHPKVKVITASQTSYEYLKNRLPNEIVLIPSHHLNMERARRERREISMAGYIGSPSVEAIQTYEEIAQQLKKVGYDFKTCFDYKERKDAMNLYKSIDLFVIGFLDCNRPHIVPTKIVNAASFGIPTIAKPILGYKELKGYYVPANNIEELLAEAKKFKDLKYYHHWAKEVSAMAEKYHIEKIAKLYRKLS